MKPDALFFLIYATVLVLCAVLRAAQSGPAVHLTANPPWSAVFPGETITLTCQVIESEGWTFIWTRHRQGGVTQLKASSADSSVFVLNAETERDGRMYQCKAVKGNESAFSNFHSITVFATRPQAVIVTDPPASVMFTGETVSLACDIRKGSGWRYSWSRNTQGRLESLSAHSTESQQKHILRSVKESDSGEYWCQGERGQNPVIQSFPGLLVLKVSGKKPKPVITQNSPSGEMYTGERVTLSCGIGGDPAGWEYLWYKDTLRHTLPNTDSYSTDGSSFTISSAALAHSGTYWCRAARGRPHFYTRYSGPLPLEISGIPETHLAVQSGWTEVFPNETVTLRCEVEGSSTEWMYKWYRDGQELPVGKADSSSVNGDTYTILSADQSHAGLYTCRGDLTRRPSVHSLIGSSVTLTVRALPEAHLTVRAGWTEVFTTETVTLRCEIEGSSTEWMYKWYRDGQELPVSKADSSSVNGDTYTILSADQSHAGLYTCRGELTRRPSVHSLTGSSATLTVRALPEAHLTVRAGWTEVFTNETVTLRCEVEGNSTEWMYKWYRDGQELPVGKANSSSVNGDTYTILSADQSHAGLYTCRGELTRRPSVHSLIGSSATLTVGGKKPKPVITQNSPSGEMYTGERVTLSCGIGGDPAGWEYLWYKDEQEHNLPNTDSYSTDGSSFTISSAALAHSGTYCCRAARGRPHFYSNYSDPLPLEISARPQALVILDKGWMDIVMIIAGILPMRCEIQGDSADWNYTWYRDGMLLSLNHTGERPTVGLWDSSSHSEYRCQGNKTDRPYYTLISKGFMPSDIRPYYFGGLAGSVIILIILVVLAVKCFRNIRKSGEKKPDRGEYYSRVNPDYISADCGSAPVAMYEEVHHTSETEGAEAAGQDGFYSVIQLAPLKQSPTA